MQIGKKAEISDELIGVIIAVAGSLAVIFFLFSSSLPGYDRVSAARESYFEMIEEAVRVADSGGKGEFYMIDLGDVEGGDADFYLIYFGKNALFSFEGRDFSRKPSGANALCVCSLHKGKSYCKDCLNLNLPAVYQEREGEGSSVVSGKLGEWVFMQDDRLVVRKTEGNYVFENI
jgi:hypothetical protein